MARPHLKVVASATPAVETHPRPFETMYYTSRNAKPQEWCAKGRAASPKGALRAAFLRVFDRRAEMAVVHGESGAVIARVWRERGSITATGSAIIARGVEA